MCRLSSRQPIAMYSLALSMEVMLSGKASDSTSLKFLAYISPIYVL